MSNCRISFLLVLSFCFLLGMATKAEVENLEKEAKPVSTAIKGGKAFVDEEIPLIKPEEEPALYRTEIKQITPNSGIATGHVIAYGHYIKPPYKLEVREDTLLFLNGLRIYPCLINLKVRAEEERKIDEKYKVADMEAISVFERQEILFDKIRTVYYEITPIEGREKAIDSILDLIKQDSIVNVVDTNRWEQNGFTLDVEYYLPGYCEPPDPPCFLSIEFRVDSSRKLSPYFKKRVKERAIDEKVRLGKDLKENKTIICTSFNQAINTYKESDFWEILEILKSKEFSLNKKLEKLFSIAAVVNGKELIYNFEPTEWPLNRKSED